MAEMPDNYLLKAVDLLMGRISEQIMTLLEERARGTLDERAFQSRIRDLLGTISPEVVARHPMPPAAAAPRPEPERPDLDDEPELGPPCPVIEDGVTGFDDLKAPSGYVHGKAADTWPVPPADPCTALVPDELPEFEVEMEIPDAEPPSPPTPHPPPAPRPKAPGPPPQAPAEPPSRPAPCPPPTRAGTPAGPGPTPATPPKPPPRPCGGQVMVSGRWDTDVSNVSMEDFAAQGRFNEDKHGLPAPPMDHRKAALVKDMASREFTERRRFKSPATAALLSALVAGVGDFYVGAMATGILFYAAYFSLVVLFILRWNYHFLLALPVVCAVSAFVSHANARRHNDMVHALTAKTRAEEKRETHFSMR